MHAPKEVRDKINRYRSLRGKKNGVVKHLWEDIWMSMKIETSKNNRKSDDSNVYRKAELE